MTHRSIRLIDEACTSCMICVRECPTWCITLDAHTALLPGQTPGPRARTHTVLDAFSIDWGLCMMCGACIELCPFDALEWDAAPVAAVPARAGLRARLDGAVTAPDG